MTTLDGRGPLGITRRGQILDVLQARGTLRVTELSDILGVAAVTVRRDIAQLASEGLIHRVHGGATLAAPDDAPALPAAPPSAAALVTAGTAATVAAGPGQVTRARSPRPHEGRPIGMLVPSLDYYWPGVVRGAEEAARNHGLKIVLRGSSYDADDTGAQLMRLIDQADVAGLVLAPNMDAPHTHQALEWLASTGIPVALIERTATVGPEGSVVESVVSDHVLGAGLAVRHLWSLGHRRIGLVLSRNSPHVPHLRRGWSEAAVACGFDPGATVDVSVPGPRAQEWPHLVDDLLDRCRDTATTALLVHADAEAIGLVQRCETRGLAVPGDLSVVAYDDEIASLFSPPLTAVRPARRSLGRAVVDLVAARLADPGRPAHRVVISPMLRIRESTAPPRA